MGTNTQMMSNTGLSTELGSRNSTPGWQLLRSQLERVLASLPPWMKSRLWYDKVKGISDSWVKKLEVLVKEWVLLDNTVTELNSWVAKDKSAEGENQFSLEKMESTLGELKNIFKQKEKLVEGL